MMYYIKEALNVLPDLPVYISMALLLLGIYYIFIKGSGEYYKGELLNFINEDVEENDYFVRMGQNITANGYRLGLYAICGLIFIGMGANAITKTSVPGLLLGIIVAVAIGYLFQPKRYLIGEIESPFYKMVAATTKRRSEELERELYNSVTLLKNIAIAQEGEPLSADTIMEKLMENAKKLKPVFADMLQVYRQGDKTKALRRFAMSIGTRNASTFAQTLEKIDKTSPAELRLQITSLQETMADERFTSGLEKAESKGTTLFGLATVAAFVCLLNFLFVCVLIDAMDMLGGFI